jgi:hypothetical protein
VQTVSYKSQDRLGDNFAALPALQTHGEPLRAAALAVVDPMQATDDGALPTALAAWAMVPPALPPARWSAAEQPARDAVVPAVQPVAPEAQPVAPQAQPVAPEAAEHPAVAPREHHARAHRRRHAAVQPQQPPDTPETESVPAPVNNSLRSVLDKMFRPD